MDMSFLDQYSSKPMMKVKGKKRYANCFGKSLGLILIISNFTIILILLLKIFRKNELNILQNIELDSDPIKLIDDFPLYMTATDNLGEEFDEPHRLYDIKCKYLQIISNGKRNLTIQDIPVENYEVNKTGNMLRDEYTTTKQINLKPYNVSVSMTQLPRLSVSSLRIYINKCENSTIKNDCLPDEVINKKLRDARFSILFFDSKVDTKSYYEPISPQENLKVFQFTTSLNRIFKVYMNIVTFFSDDGLIFEDIRKSTSYRIDDIKEQITLELGNNFYPGNLGQIEFKTSGKKEIFNRSYPKMQTIIPNLVAFYQISLMISKIIASIIYDGKLEEYVLSEVLEIKTNNYLYKSITNVEFSELFKVIPKFSVENDIFENRKKIIKNNSKSSIDKNKKNLKKESNNNFVRVENVKISNEPKSFAENLENSLQKLEDSGRGNHKNRLQKLEANAGVKKNNYLSNSLNEMYLNIYEIIKYFI